MLVLSGIHHSDRVGDEVPVKSGLHHPDRGGDVMLVKRTLCKNDI